MKAVVAAFNQEKALVGAFSVIVQPVVEPMDRFTALMIDDDEDGSILSLGLFPGEILEIPGDDRTMFRFEAAWDSSLHNSLLLNRVTPSGETVYMTISAYLEVSFIISISLSYPPIIKQSVHCSWRAAPSQPSSPRTSP